MKGIGTGRLKAEHSPKYQRVERERRYLLRTLPQGLALADPHFQITDNYITATRLRLRKARWVQTNEWTLKLTQKHTPAPPDFPRTLITTIYLDEAEYEVLSVFEANELRKNRYPFEHEGRTYSVDVSSATFADSSSPRPISTLTRRWTPSLHHPSPSRTCRAMFSSPAGASSA